MSLFIGSIPYHVSQEDLERVFRKFGSCNLQVKDTFGFVDYDYPVNAERALQTLQGKRICGQLMTLSWSNRQLKPTPGARPVNFHESQHGRNFHETQHGRNLHESQQGRNLHESQHGRNLHKSQHGKTFHESHHGRNLLESQLGKTLHESLHGKTFRESRHGKTFHESQHGRNLHKSQHSKNLHEYHHEKNVRESHHGKHNRKESYVNRKMSSEGRMGYNTLVVDCKVFRPTDKPEDARNRDVKNAEISGMKKKLTDAKREKHIDDLLPNRNELENVSEFDRYEPYSNDDKRDHEVQRSRGREYGKMKRTRESQSPENQRSESPSPERLRARKSRKTMSSPSRSDDVSRSKSNSMYSKSTTKFASNSNSGSRSLSSSSTFSSKPYSHRSRDHRSKSGSRSSSPSRASMNVSTSAGRSSTPPTKFRNGKNNSFTERNEAQFRSKLGSRSRASSRASLNVSTPSGRSSTPPPKLHNGENNCFTSSERNEVQIKRSPLVENGNEVLASQKGEEDTRLLESGGLTVEIRSPTIHKKAKEQVDLRSHKTMKLLCMTSEEILMVIKHYGLKQPDGVVDKDLPVESFFGCARLWPLDVVNYRRLKKGSISTENYARRIFQNKAFGIVDRYVRSSSGWDEDTCTW